MKLYSKILLLLTLPAGTMAFHVMTPQSTRNVPTLYMFGFGQETKQENKELTLIRNVGLVAKDDSSTDSLFQYLLQWSKLLEEDYKGMGLTTRIKASPLDADGGLGVRILFQPSNTGMAYVSTTDEKRSAQEKKEGDTTPKKKKPKSEGGIDILIEKTENKSLDIRARRCEIEEGTLIKEMSEEAIIAELKKAAKVWKQEHDFAVKHFHA
mmetsp:Transcript_17197/g.26062  ORF Transcript_17197/g.26062 Transcript_17197/m.26062 type:complete len:210 (-) Transcript_17197:289-918(-)